MSDRAARTALEDALALRAHCLSLWETSGQATVVERSLASASAQAWRLVLAGECCALSLGRRLREGGMHRRLPSETIDIIASAESREMQRVLAARHVLRMVDEAGREAGVRVIVLKGGIAAGEPAWEAVDLGDVDIMVVAENAERVWQTLVRRGWRCAPGHDIDFADMASHDAFMSIHPPGIGVHVDFHQWKRDGSMTGGTRAIEPRVVPMHGFATLDRQIGVEVALELLRHSVVKHPYRRGHVRDLVLLAQFVRELSAAERNHLVERISRDAYARELGEQYAQVLAVEQGHAPTDGAATIRFVASKYASVLEIQQGRSTLFPAWRPLTMIALERPAIRLARYADELRAARSVPPSSPLMRTARHHGLLPPRLIWLLRLGYRVGLVAMVALVGPALRRRFAALRPAGESPE